MIHTKSLTFPPIICMGALCGVLLLHTGCRTEESRAAQLPERVPVTVRQVVRHVEQEVIPVSGSLEADKTAPLSFLVPGKVDRVAVEEGARVVRGQVLATIETHNYRSNLTIAEASMARAQDAHDRFEPLYREGAYAETDFVALQTGLAQAAAARDIARKALRDTTLYASIDGVVGVSSIEVGQMVSPGMPAFVVVKTDVVQARVAVPESEVGRVTLQQPAHVSIPALEDRTFQGRVSMIAPVADTRTRTYAVEIELPNPHGILRPGMIVQARIRTERSIDRLTVPGNAIVRGPDNLTCVYVVDRKKGRALRRRITPGAVCGNEIAVRSGLQAKEVIVVAGQHKLEDGTPVSLINP